MVERDDGSIEHGPGSPDYLADLVQRARLRAAEVYLGSGNRDLQYLLAEYDRRGVEIAKLRAEVADLEGELEDQQEQFDQLIVDIGGVSPG